MIPNPRSAGILPARRAPGRRLGEGRWVGAALAVTVAAAVLTHLSPAVEEALQFNRAAVVGGQWWRLITGNFVHCSWVHLGVNLGAFAALLWIACGRGRGVAWVVALSAAAVGAGVYLWADGITTYRGISGVASALLGWVMVTMAAQDRGRQAAVWAAAVVVIAVKSVIEMIIGGPFLPTSAPPGIAVVPVTHLVGLAVGAGLALAGTRLRLRRAAL